MLLIFKALTRIIWSVALVYSLAEQQHMVNKTTSDGNDFSQCTSLKNCFNSCINVSEVEPQCQAPSLDNNISTCACSDVHCSRLKSWCLLRCKGGSTVGEECAECLLHNDSNACSWACFSSGVCALREDCDDAVCHACAPGFFGARCDKRCAAECRGPCYGDSGYCYQCERGKYGRACEQNCSSHCYRNSCLPETGLCRSCSPGYVGTTCSQPCTKGYFGLKCIRPCSINCLNASCDHVNGRCVHGCVPGFFNVFCDKMCPGGNYGAGCLANCPVTCAANEDKSSCDHATGACLFGCKEGFRGDLCSTPCSAGQFGRNCERNCSDRCFLQVCNQFSGHCMRCEVGREGPFCEDVKAMAAKVSNYLGTDISTDQVILIFITLFIVGGCLWLTLAGSMYHRRKLMWQKIWNTGKLPGHYRLPRIWKQTLERASMSPVQRYHSLRRYARSPEARKTQRRRNRRERLVSSESSDESDTSSTIAEVLPSDKVLDVVGQGGGDTVPKVPLGVGMLMEGVHSTVMRLENVADGAKVETHPRISDSTELAVKPFALTIKTHPWSESWQSRVAEGSGASSTAKLTSNTVQVGTGSGGDFGPGRPLRLLRAMTRTSAVRELESSATRFSITTEETRTSTSSRLIVGRLSALRMDSETANDTTALTESETNRSVQTETEAETTSEAVSETSSETSQSSSPASTSTVKSKSVTLLPKNKITKERLRTHSPMLIKAEPESPRSKQWTMPRPLLPPYQLKPPTPTKPQGLFRKGFKFLSNMIPVTVTGPVPRKELSQRTIVTNKAHMSSRFLLTRLDDWRRTREKQLEIKEGFVEVIDEKNMSAKKKASTVASSVVNATTTPTLNTSATSFTRESVETGPTTGRTSGVTTKTWATTASAITSSSERQSSTSRKSATTSSPRSPKHAQRKLRRRDERTASGSRATSRPTTSNSSYSTSRTAGYTLSASPSSQTLNTITVTEPSTATESETRHKESIPSVSVSGQRSTVESRPHLKRRAGSPSHKNPPTLQSLKKELKTISSAFPKTTLTDLHADAMKSLARLEAPQGENRARYGRSRRQKERSDVISYHSARKPVKRFRENTSPTLGVSSSTQNVSRTIGNQSTVPSSFSTGATTETGS